MLIRKLFKEIGFWSIPFFILISFLFLTKIIKKDFIYAHYLASTVKPPHNWMYDFTVIPLKKFFISLKNDNQNYLPKVGLYLSESKRNYFLSNIPNTVKEWQRGKIVHYFNDNVINDVRIRLRGDNPDNWLKEKQSFRIKLRKNEMHERQRYYNYLPFEIRILTSTRMASNSGLLAPKVKPIELLLNGKKKGLYLELENFNENFLRRNKIMPVNFYKGENYNQEIKINLPGYLYNNSGLWSKEAYFNFYEKENKSDLKKFLEVLNNSKHDLNKFKILQSYFDEEYMGRYLAYVSLTQNFHSSRYHNNRLIIDPWKGQIFPVITDAMQNFDTTANFDESSNDLTSILNQSSKFIDLKYYYLKKLLFEEKIFEKEIEYLLKHKKNINSVMKNDPVLSNILPQFLSENKNYEIIDDTINGLKKRKKTLLSEVKKIPNIYWMKNNKNFSIILNDTLPINRLKFSFDMNAPKWIFVDENYNGIYDENEIKFYSKNNELTLDLSLYSNRINLSDYYNLSHNNIKVKSTKFNFITSNGKIPKKIEADNIFLNNYFIIKYNNEKKTNAIKTHNLNQIIFKKDQTKEDSKTKILSGKIIVDQDLIFEDPVLIKEGTTFLIEKDRSLIFKNKLLAIGNNDNKIKFLAKSKNPWGTIAIIGKNTNGSKLKYLDIENGSGSFSDKYYFTSMLSLHNTSNIELDNIRFENNSHYDDMLHVIYCSDINLKNLFFSNANGDAIDIDISEKISILNSNIFNSRNDGIDLMESDVLIENVNIVNSQDKGISIGEASKANIFKTELKDNVIGVAVKDYSEAYMENIKFIKNDTQISAYKKNLQYGSGGKVIVNNSVFQNDVNKFQSLKSNMLINNVQIIGKILKEGENIDING